MSDTEEAVADGDPVAERPPGSFDDGHALGAPGAMVVIISGPSGVGKDTIIDAMRRMPSTPRHYVITCTTREKRWYEADGVDYHFLTVEEFQRQRERGGFLETSEVHGNWYGTPRDQVVEALIAGKDAILKIDVAGARAVREAVAEALMVFVVPPSLDELRRRLVGRDTEPPEALRLRWENAAKELLRQNEYDHVVVNHTGQADSSAADIEAVIAAEHAAHPDRRLRI